MRLSPEQVQEFRENGVLIAKNILSDADLRPLIDEYNAFVDRRARELHAEGKLSDLAEKEGFETRIGRLFAQSSEIMQGMDVMHNRGAAAFQFLLNKNLLNAVESLIGPEITCSPIQHLRAKVPGNLGKGNYELVPWHQDSAVTWEEADSADIVTCWIPLVDATRERGCMEILPGISKLGYIEHTSEGGTQIRPDRLPKVAPLCAECPRGGVVFMTKLTPHRGLPNLSDTARWTIDLRYQRTGTPTGRPFYPDFPVRSAKDPASVLSDHAEWSRRWVEALEREKVDKHPWHRAHKPAMAM